MPYLNDSPNSTILPLSGHPVTVMASFKCNSEFIPLQFCYEDENCEIHRFKVDSIHSIKEKYNIVTFRCSYVVNDRRIYVLLNYDRVGLAWTIE